MKIRFYLAVALFSATSAASAYDINTATTAPCPKLKGTENCLSILGTIDHYDSKRGFTFTRCPALIKQAFLTCLPNLKVSSPLRCIPGHNFEIIAKEHAGYKSYFKSLPFKSCSYHNPNPNPNPCQRSMENFVDVVSKLSEKNNYNYKLATAVEPLLKSCKKLVKQCYVGNKPDRKEEGVLIQERYCTMKNFSHLPLVFRSTRGVW